VIVAQQIEKAAVLRRQLEHASEEWQASMVDNLPNRGCN
jgi:hypothetical protein